MADFHVSARKVRYHEDAPPISSIILAGPRLAILFF